MPSAGEPAATATLPLLPTTVVGSHGLPGWLHVARAAVARGEFGPTDLEELYADATQLAILDQERAGVDVPSDGEMRRLHFVQGFYGRLHGLEPLPAARKLGAPGYDMVPQYRAVERITLRPRAEQDPSASSPSTGAALAPPAGSPSLPSEQALRLDSELAPSAGSGQALSAAKGPAGQAIARLPQAGGLGIVEEYTFARTLTDRPLKVTCPGPLMLALQIQPDGAPYRDRFEIAADLAGLINAELHRCADAGARIVQLDDPSFSFHRSGVDAVLAPVAAAAAGDVPAAEPPPAGELAHLYNAAVAGLRERGVKLLLHLCFGNFHGRPRTARSYRTLFPGVLEARCDQFVLEFAGRELAELDLWREYAIDRELGAGVVDVKAFYPETAAQVAARIRQTLRYVPAEKLWLNPDCGFNHSARWVCAAKLNALVAGTRLARADLGMEPK
jgi:5-methyltetrahydropteroyltriglutamate--homocysteine methyltransferase